MPPGEEIGDNSRRDGKREVDIIMEGVVEELEGCAEETKKVKHEAGIIEEAEKMLEGG
jgi:hypothetical protein